MYANKLSFKYNKIICFLRKKNLIELLIFRLFNIIYLKLGMGRIHYPVDYPVGYPVSGYPVSGGKIGRIAGYHFSIITF